MEPSLTHMLYRLAYKTMPFDQATDWCFALAKRNITGGVKSEPAFLKRQELINKIKKRHGWG